MPVNPQTHASSLRLCPPPPHQPHPHSYLMGASEWERGSPAAAFSLVVSMWAMWRCDSLCDLHPLQHDSQQYGNT